MSLGDKPVGVSELRWVSTGWLEEYLENGLTVLDVQPDCHDYFMAHIPGACTIRNIGVKGQNPREPQREARNG
jgi:hypothetical protein